jgi:hypothetical protein
MTGDRADLASEQPGRIAGWNAADMNEREDWRILLSENAKLEADLATLELWRTRTPEPISALQHGLLDTPVLQAIGQRVARQVHGDPGFAWLSAGPSMSQELFELFYLAIGLHIGESINTYGRLYTIRDYGQSYKENAIPVSQTHDSTGPHTDSSNKKVWPAAVGLACVRPSKRGGTSRLVSVPRVSALLRSTHPEAFALLHRAFMRDVVTPDSDRSLDAVRANVFPVLLGKDGETMRYMRYWIEKGHERVGVPLDKAQRDAFDALDALLEDPSLNLRFKMQAGDLLFLNNRSIAHDRDAYEDDATNPRHLIRLWLTDRQQDSAS